MGELRRPDETYRVAVEGGEVAAYSFGDGERVLLCVHGGPGMTCDYLRDSHSVLADHGYRVVAWDQLGCGESDRPEDTSLYTIPRYVEEVETVRTALGLGRVHLLGQSWGTWLATEYCLKYLENVVACVIANGSGSVPHTVAEMKRLREALGPETVAMMQRHEARGATDHPAYEAAVTILYYRHLCRLDEWPEPLKRSVNGLNPAVYGTMWGPNEFCCVGTLKDWDRLADMKKITVPCLIVTGLHDELTPDGARLMQDVLPDARTVVLPNSSHTPFFEEPAAYFAVLREFLDRI